MMHRSNHRERTDGGGRRRAQPYVVTMAVVLLGILGSLPMLVRAEAPSPKAPVAAGAAADTTAAPHRVLAYYFHTTQRCVSCRKIEAYTAEAIATGFAQELKDGRLFFQAVNIDQKDNEHFVRDYKLFTKSVIIVDQQSGQQVAWKNLPKVWELLSDKAKFVRYIQEETRGYLTGKQP